MIGWENYTPYSIASQNSKWKSGKFNATRKKIAFRIQINATQIRFRPYFKSRQNNNKKIPLVSKLKVTSFLPLLLSLLPTRDKVLESGLMEKRKVAAPSTQKANKAKTSDFSMRWNCKWNLGTETEIFGEREGVSKPHQKTTLKWTEPFELLNSPVNHIRRYYFKCDVSNRRL